MPGLWKVSRVQQAEQRVMATVPADSLMRRAAFGVATTALTMLRETKPRLADQPRRVGLLVGAGNNGGDALWAGAFLRQRGVAVYAVLLSPDRAHRSGLAALRQAGGRVVPELPSVDLVIDGIVGLSGHGPLRETAAKHVAAITVPILAVDLPSGIAPDTGVIEGPAVKASMTVTFGARKPAHILADCGEVRLIDIGLGGELGDPDLIAVDSTQVGRAWPVPGPLDDKYTQGVTGVAAGSAAYPGAAVLSVGGAVMATSGMVRYAGSATEHVLTRWPEVICAGSPADTGQVQSWVIGPGLGITSGPRDALRQVLNAGVPVCVDADALTMLAEDDRLWDARDPATPIVLTPHDREFTRFGVPLTEDRVVATKTLSAERNAIVLLKGHVTIVAAPDGRVLLNRAPTSWAATAGSGDVLSGIVGALLAAGLDPLFAAGYAAHAHGLAAQLAGHGAPITASALLAALPRAIRALRVAPDTAGGSH